jgi:hypothetical protein
MDTTDLNYQVDSFAKDLSTIFMNVVNSGKVSDFRDIFQTMDEDNSGKHRVYGSTVVIVIVDFYDLIPLLNVFYRVTPFKHSPNQVFF